MKKYFSFGLLFMVLAVLPSLHIVPSLEVYNEKRIFQVGLLVLVGLLFVGTDAINRVRISGTKKLGAGWRYVPQIAQWSIAGFLALGLLSMVLNGDWYYGLQELSLYILLLAFLFYTSARYLETQAQFNRGIAFLLLGFGGFYLLKFIVGYGMHLWGEYPLWPGERYQNFLFGFANMRFLNQVQVWTLPLFLVWATGKSSGCRVHDLVSGKKNEIHLTAGIAPGGIKYFFFLLAAFWWCLIARTASEGTILCLFIAPCITLWLFKEKAHAYIKKYLGAVVSGVILKFVLFDLFTTGGIAKSYENATGMGRLNRWGKMITDMIEQPFLGFGPMSFAKISERYHAGHPHNSILQVGYEFGIPAMIVVVVLVFWGLYQWYKQTILLNKDNEFKEPVIQIGITTSLLSGLGYSLFSGVIVMPLSQLWMILIGGWALGRYIKNKKAIQGISSNNKRGINFVKVIVCAAIIFLSYSVIQDVPHLKENQQQYIKKYGGKYHPRFWQQGKIGLEE